ncbi:MAG: hypothetical protein E6Q88_11315 [Lysobacteraceae bacterium]|nr:MAG: hypothetical protein E6Q88_11315 [Xanthomonadaceae bacterium]
MSPSARNLILSNAATLWLAIALRADIGWLMWPYWVQSVIIGWYARKRMLHLGKFSTKGFKSGGKPVPETEKGKRWAANFFALHYGFFHLGYLIFLLGGHLFRNASDPALLLACGVSYLFSQRQTYEVQHAADLRGRPNLGKIMATPYLRIVPMHLGMLLCGGIGFSIGALILFAVLKTATDIGLDAIDRRMAERGATTASKPAA